MRSRLGLRTVVALAALAGTSAWAAGPGLAVAPTQDAWPRWAARLNIGTQVHGPADGLAATPRTRSLQLLGDYYLDRPRLGDAGGLRLTSGVLVGTRGGMLDPVAASAWRPGALALAMQVSASPLRDPAATEAVSTWPYLGVGYSAASLRGGWGFSADLGLAAQNPGGLRLGSQSLDDAVRELRLRPLVQVGVSYAF